MFLTIVIGIIVLLYLYVKFMEGYNSMDTPRQVRKIAKMKEEETKQNRLKELEREKEILELKKEIENLKNKGDI